LRPGAVGRVWKAHDWSVLGRLYEWGYITDPARKAKSVVLTEIGLAEAQRLFEELFCRKDDAGKNAAPQNPEPHEPHGRT
jgi:hypothetical protein